MKKGALSLFFILLLFIILAQRDVFSNENKIEQVVLESLANNSNVEVIVELKEPQKTRTINEVAVRELRKNQQENIVDSLNDNEFKENYHYENAMNGLSGNVSIEGLQKLANNPDVKFIYLNKVRHIALNQSTPLVNATVVRQKIIGSFNLTGEGIGVCILDSGLNYSHSAFGGCSNSTFLNGSCKRVPNGYDMVNNDSDPYDDNGHGTHVAGIIGANDTTTFGVAPSALLIPIKVCNSGGSCSDSNIIKGFDWCIGNRSNPNFNISVISMSLG
ncbi:S8 family serine peptidase, partial [Candidatus Woesearchaeota archaeon]|nr:S8 family serine peptidase [Candidatus Woesearchaeota archaeon]